jgi:hypothetical protein
MTFSILAEISPLCQFSKETSRGKAKSAEEENAALF